MPVPVEWIHAFIDVPPARVETAGEFWSAVTDWPIGEPWQGHPEFCSLLPAGGTRYLHLQTISGAPRVHLDLEGDPERDPARLEALGATREHRGDGWQVMTSPAGLPFCVCGESSTPTRPSAAYWPEGHRSRLVQLCIDVPAEQYDDELVFWRAATGWTDEPDNAPEFHRLVHHPQSPLQLLIQRLGDDDPARRARAHLDLGTDDMPAEVARLETLGAEVLRPGDGFIALRDTVGMPFCVTRNHPDR